MTTSVITISRQFGAGGATVGRRLARQLGFRYLDREILRQAALQIQRDETTLAAREERVSSLWQSLLDAFALGPAEAPCVNPLSLPYLTDQDLFDLETTVIRDVAAHHDAVIVGRAGFSVLADHPGRLSVFLHAPLELRVENVRRYFHIEDPAQAKRVIRESDRDRERFIGAMTGRHWQTATNFHLCIDTGLVGEALAATLIARLAKGLQGRREATEAGA